MNKKVDYELAQKMLLAGKTTREIAKHFGVSSSAIRQGFNKRDIPFQKPRTCKEVNLDLPIEQIAYMAGLIDGEGSININRKGNRFWLTVDVGTTDTRLLSWLLSNIGGHTRVSTKKNLKHKTGYHWTLCSNQAKRLLQLILPYLVIKKEEAIIGIQFQETMKPQNKLSEEILKRREEMRCELKRLRLPRKESSRLSSPE